MKNGTDKRKMTLLFIRDAQHPPKQLQCSPTTVILVPAIAILSISTLMIGLNIRSSHIISQLETNLAVQHLQMEVTVTDKDEAIARLRNQVLKLSNQADNIQDRLQRVNELEQQLQQFIHKYDNKSPSAADHKGNVSSLYQAPSGHKGGEIIAVYDHTALPEQDTRDDYQHIQKLLDTIEQTAPWTLGQAQAMQKSREEQQTTRLLQTRRLYLASQSKPTIWPVGSRRLTSSFGYRSDPFTGKAAYHAGIDIAGRTGDPVYAAGSGTVTEAEYNPSRGQYIIIEHPDGLQTWYMHLNSIQVNSGEQVTKGQSIGHLGNTGRSTGPHLHFQVVKQNTPVDPLLYVR